MFKKIIIKLFLNIYSVLFTLAIPLIFGRLLYRSIKAPFYRKRLLERLGILKSPVSTGGLLLHAVSVGEVVAAMPLIKLFQEYYPNMPITITTITPTGSERAKNLLGLGNSIQNFYLPYDLPWALSIFLNCIKPDMLIIMETELWPNLLIQCNKRAIPIIITNGRLTDRSVKKYLKLGVIMPFLLNKVNLVVAQSKLDGQRFLKLGLQPHKLHVTSNLKFDLIPSQIQKDLGQEFKKNLKNRLVLVAASTHAGEEELVLAAFDRIRENWQEALLILVPRHPERFNTVASLLKEKKYSFVTRSSKELCLPQHAVLLGDTMGELAIFYQAADVAFIGGSLVAIGGHNLLEAAAYKLPIIVGPYLHKCLEIRDLLIAANALIIVKDSEELSKAINNLFNCKATRSQVGQQALSVITKNQGSALTIMNLIEPIIKSKGVVYEKPACKS